MLNAIRLRQIMIQDIVISGLINGGVYALLAVGFSLLFGVARIIYLAHTALYMVAAYIIYASTNMYGLPSLIAAVIAVVGTTLLAVVTYRLFIDRIREHETAVLLVTIALGLSFPGKHRSHIWPTLPGDAGFCFGIYRISGC